jgi:hypothetical protein
MWLSNVAAPRQPGRGTEPPSVFTGLQTQLAAYTSLLWGAKVLHFLGVDVEVVATAFELRCGQNSTISHTNKVINGLSYPM